MVVESTFKFLTILILLTFSSEVFSVPIVKLENAKNYFRMNIFAKKDSIKIKKKDEVIYIKGLRADVMEQLRDDLNNISSSNEYISKTIYQGPTEENNISIIKIITKDPAVEFFTFYRDREQKHVVDFWIEKNDKLTDKIAPIKKNRVSLKKNLRKIPPVLKRKKVAKKAKVIKKKEEKFKDFRYGASFIWNYLPLIPKSAPQLNIERKTPEFYYEVKNRKFEENKREAHLQLIINLYRKQSFGLMNNAIRLFQKKYGEDEEVDLVEYLKANSIVRDNLNKGNSKPVKMAISMYANLAERTSNYDLYRALTKYLISFYHSNDDFVSILKSAKNLYVQSKENFDYEESREAAEMILYALARLKQDEKLNEVIEEKTIQKILPAQKRYAYKFYTLLRLNKIEELVRSYEKIKTGLVSPVDESILFNVGEAYFRNAQYKKSVKLFDKFNSLYSKNTYNSYARLRIGLAYDFMDRNPELVLKIYKNAINRSLISDVSKEAKLRYVALRSVRKNKIQDRDRETRAFINFSNKIKNKEVLSLLWLVRLRSLIVDEKYKKALSYLSAIPLDALKPSYRRVFEGDGAEIIYGIIQKYFEKGDYPSVIKVWELYKKKYVKKVARDPYINYLAGKSFLKMGLMNGVDQIVNNIKSIKESPAKTFPIWVKRVKGMSRSENLLLNLEIDKDIHLKNMDLANRSIEKLKERKNNTKYFYYRGQVDFIKGKKISAARNFERFLATSPKNILNKEEVANLLSMYTESVYETGDLKRYQSVADALLKDVKKYDGEYIDKVKEKVLYLLIEIKYGKDDDSLYPEILLAINNFQVKFKSSVYKDRLKYIRGNILISKIDEKKGVELYNSMLTDENVAEHIKGMIRSDLTLMKVKNRKI